MVATPHHRFRREKRSEVQGVYQDRTGRSMAIRTNRDCAIGRLQDLVSRSLGGRFDCQAVPVLRNTPEIADRLDLGPVRTVQTMAFIPAPGRYE